MTSRFDDALRYASAIHAGQRKKGTDIPYIAHLLAVVAIVLEHDGDENVAIAALLHDAAEDQGGRGRLADVGERFGADVASIVEACTDTFEQPKPPWVPRKQAYVGHIALLTAPALLVSAADKLANARAILDDYREIGPALWNRFSGRRAGTLWYYHALLRAFSAHPEARQRAEIARLVGRYASVVGELRQQVRAKEPDWVEDTGEECPAID